MLKELPLSSVHAHHRTASRSRAQAEDITQKDEDRGCTGSLGDGEDGHSEQEYGVGTVVRLDED